MSSTATPPAPSPADARSWSARVPRRLLTVAAPSLIGVAIIAAIPGEQPQTIAEVASAASALTTVAQAVALASIPLLVVRPHATIGWAALGTTGVAASPAGESARQVWAVVALVLALVALADAAGTARQRVVARSWTRTSTLPACGPVVREVVAGRRWVPTLVAVGCLVVAVVGTGWWLRDDVSVRAFRELSQPVDGVVVSVTDTALAARVRLDTGETVRVGTPSTSPAVGDRVVVMTAPGTDRAELVSDPFDPTGSLLVGVGALLAAVVLLRDDAHRRRASRRMFQEGGPTLTLVAVPTGGRWLALEPLGAPGRTTTRVRVGWDVPDELDVEPEDGWDDEDSLGGDEDWLGEGEDDESGDVADDYADWVAERREALARVSDEELLASGAEQRAEREASDQERALAAAPLVGPTVVEVHGLQAQGDYPLLRVDGRWLVTDRPARDTALAAVARPLRLLGIPQPVDVRTVHRSAAEVPGTAPAPALWRVVLGATGSWLPWLLTPAVGWLAWWVAGSASVRHLLQLTPLLLLGYAWTTLAQDRLALSAAGIRVRSAVLGVLVRWPDLVRVVADDDSLVLRVDNPPDALVVHQHRELGRFLPGALGPPDVVRLVEAARPAPGQVRRSPAILLTPGSSVLLAWTAATVAGALLA